MRTPITLLLLAACLLAACSGRTAAGTYDFDNQTTIDSYLRRREELPPAVRADLSPFEGFLRDLQRSTLTLERDGRVVLQRHTGKEEEQRGTWSQKGREVTVALAAAGEFGRLQGEARQGILVLQAQVTLRALDAQAPFPLRFRHRP
jgi:hypothetical protein